MDRRISKLLVLAGITLLTALAIVSVSHAEGLPVSTKYLKAPFPDVRIRPQSIPPAVSTSGAFRLTCTYSHFNYDDSINSPGEHGVAHGHMYFGNTRSDADSTAESIANSGDSTCAGGIANRSSYWMPVMIDTRTGAPVLPDLNILVYYKTGQFNVNGSADGWIDPVTGKLVPFQPPVVFESLPVGLRMVAGNAHATKPRSNSDVFDYRWSCQGQPDAKFGSTIPNCDVGAKVYQEVFFPPCWDGMNLDSPDHKSHMSYGVTVLNKNDPRGWSHIECPKTHPKVIVGISFNVAYTVKYKNDPTYWRLVTDTTPANAPGWTLHGDWRNGWMPSVSEAWMDGCIRSNHDCHGYLLGNGTELF